MSKNKVEVTGGHVSWLGLLCLVFIGLKLAEVGVVATWSWWWVLAPIWIIPALFLGGLALIGLWVLTYAMIASLGRSK